MAQKTQRIFRIKYLVPDDEYGAIEMSTGDIAERDLPKYDWMSSEYDGVRIEEVTL